ncbi:hypothetical protein ACVWYN_002235 [Pedobacter sp. UYP24]
MGNEKIFELHDIGLVQAGKSIMFTFGLFAFGLLGSMVYSLFVSHSHEGLFFHLRNGTIFFAIVYGIRQLFSRKKTKDIAHQLLIKISNDTITIEIDRETAFSGSLKDLKSIRTLDPANPKADVQGQIYIGNQIFNLASSLNRQNKLEFDSFVLFCKNALKMQIKSVPFSVFTSNFQGVKYIEYFNPKNPLTVYITEKLTM